MHEFDTPASTTWAAANRALYIPFVVDIVVVITAIAVPVGAASSGNVDVGIYNRDGVRLVSSGSTAQALANTLQTFDITDLELGPGFYYAGLAIDNTTATTLAITSPARRMGQVGGLIQASAFPLPATATFAASASGQIPVMSLLVSPRTAF